MRVRFICGYYSDLAHKNKKRRPEDYWDARNFCWAAKYGGYKRPFNIHDGAGHKTAITPQTIGLARRRFGDWIEKSVASLGADAKVLLVPVPSKDGLVRAQTFRSLEMTDEAVSGRGLAGRVNGGVRWTKQLPKAHEGNRPGRAELASLLSVDPSLKGKSVILVDDLITRGSNLLATADALEKGGAKVLGAIVCGKTIYDLDTPHFGEQEFDLTEELDDWDG